MNSRDITLFIPAVDLTYINNDIIAKMKKIFYDVIVIYDGDTPLFPSEYPYKIISHGENKGIAAARNTAILTSPTEYIAFLDVDCIPSANWPFKLLSYFDDPMVAGVSGKVREIDINTRADLWRAIHMAQHWGDKLKVNPDFLFGANGIYRKKALLDVGLYNEKYHTNYEDVDISRRLKKKGWKLIYDPHAIVYHKKNDNLISLLYTFWRWNFHFYEEKLSYQDINSLIAKLDDNFGYANIFLEDDFKNKRYRLLYIDFIFPLAFSIFDLCYILDCCSISDIFLSPDALAILLTLIEFSYRRATKNFIINTIIKKEYLKEQNLLYFLYLLAAILKKYSDFLWKKVIGDIIALLKLGEAEDLLYQAIIKQVSNVSLQTDFIYCEHPYKEWFDNFCSKMECFISWINKDNREIIEILNA